MNVYLRGKKLALDPARSVGKGGEADVFDISDIWGGLAVKLWKHPDHPDYTGQPAEQQAARARLSSYPAKLRDFPAGLPDRVIAPLDPCTDRAGRVVLGYSMPLVSPAQPLLRYAERSFREAEKIGAEAVVELFADLHRTLCALHQRQVVVGDLNELNVLVSGGRCCLIDSDSFQIPGHPSTTYTERLLDPLRCDALPEPVRPPGPDSDWYAYTAMLMQCLLYVGPYGGVHAPSQPGKKLTQAARLLRRLTVFHPEVRYPRPALPGALLHDDLLHHFRQVFERDVRGPFPLRLLGGPVLRSIQSGLPVAPAPAVVVRGQVRVTALSSLPPGPETPRVWVRGGQLLGDGPLGPEYIGDVLAGQTRVWTGPRFGLGFYRAGTLCVAFVFRPGRRGINDGVRLPAMAGEIVAAECVLSDQIGWLLLAVRQGARTVHHVCAVGEDGVTRAMASAEEGDGSWLGQSPLSGKCAAGPFLFCPTDAGLVRVEIAGDQVEKTREFPDTQPFVHAGSRLIMTRGGLCVADESGLRLLQIG